jgi:hypothetical protein
MQRVTIEIPGPVDETKWREYKEDVERLLYQYRTSIRARIREIAYVKVSPEEEGPTGSPTVIVTPTAKKGKRKKPR